MLFLVKRVEAYQNSEQSELKLSNSEREWLAKHPRIFVGVMDSWPPINYLDENRIAKGIGIEYLAALNKRLNNVLVPISGSFKENYDGVLKGKLHALMDITQRPDREVYFNFTRPYIEISHALVGRKKGSYFKDEQDLKGKTIALERGFYNVIYFKKNFPMIHVKEYESTSMALDAVSRGEADAYAGNRAVAIYLIEKDLLNNLQLMGHLTMSKSILQFGVKKNSQLLLSILDKALASLTPDEEREIRQHWVHDSGPELILTKAEKNWLKAHPIIRVAFDPAWAPVEFVDEDGIPQGISYEYLKKFEEQLGIRFDISKGRSWQNLAEEIRQRKLDMFSASIQIKEWDRYLGFTDKFLSIPIGIFTRQSDQYIVSSNQLAGKKVGIVQDYGLEQVLMATYPKAQIVPAVSVVAGIQMLEQGKIDAFVDSTISIAHYLNKLGITDIKLSGDFPFRYDLSMGIRSDWPELTTIFNKVLKAISASEKNLFYDKWTLASQKPRVNYKLIFKVFIVASLIICGFAFWNWRLGNEVAVRKEAEAKLLTSHENLSLVLENLHTKKNELECANQKLMEMDRLKSIFIASMSHELRTPLNSIIGFTGILLQGLAGELNDEQKRQLSMVKNSSQHLLLLITDIIDLSKIEAGKMSLNIDEFELSALVKEVLESFKIAADKKSLDLLMQVPTEIKIESDKVRVRQILVNLIYNAVEFTSVGKISVDVSLDDKDNLVTIFVRDTGVGIKRENMDKLFKTFSQVTTLDVPKNEGTGLGLYISKRLVELLGGRIGVESEFGKGSVFYFKLPKKRNL